MKGKFEYKKREGLPGGANEMQQFAQGVFSIEGYKRFSPDVNNPFNIVPSGDITMEDVDFPVHGVDNLGNSQIMYPGNDYKFPGSSVFETPLRDLDDYEEAELTDEEIEQLRAQGYVVEEFQEGGEKEGQEGSVVEPYKAVDWKDYHNRRKLYNDSLISHMVFNDPLKHSYNLPEISKEEYDKIKDKAYSKDYLEIIDNKVQKVANPEQYLKSRDYEYETTNKDYGIYRDFKPEFYRYYGSNETRPAEVGVLTTKNVDSDGNILKEYSDVIYNDIYDYAKVPYYKKPVQKILKPDSEPLKEKKVDRETYYYDGSEGPRHDFKSDVKPIVRKRESINIPKKEINLSKEYIKPSKLQSSYYRETPSQFPNVKVRHYNDGSKTYVNEQGQEAVYTYGNFPDFSKSFQYQQGGEKINPIEGDLISKVLMERNRDKEFVKRAFNPEQYPDHIQYNEDGTTSTHRMAWGTDDTGQAYMFPTIFNEANEAIPVPNQYADYISSQGYKNATGMNLKQTGGPVNKIPFEEWYKTVPEYKNDTTSYNLRRAYELAPQEELDAFVNSDAHLRSVYKQPDGIYEFVKRKDHPTVQKELDWFNSPDAAEFRKQYKLDDSGDYYKYLPIQQDGGNIFELPKAQLGLNTPFTGSNLEYERQYVKDNYGNPNKEVADKVLSYMKLIEEADKKQKALSDQRKEEAYLKTYGQPSDNTKVVMPEMPKILSSEEQAQVKAYSEAKKKQQEDFEKKQWEKYEDASTGEKVLDRVQAFAVDPIGMTTRFITGDQAYIPGMGRGLLNYDSPEYENYLRSVGYTPGEIEPSDIQNMINPMYWGASIGNNLSKGDYGNAALEGALTFAPFLPKGTGRTLMNTTKQGAKRLVNNYNQRNLVKNFKNIDPHNYKEYITNYDPEFSRMVTSPNVEFKMTQTGLADDILIANQRRFKEVVEPRVEKILDEKIARSLDPRGKQLIIQNEKEFFKSQGVKDEFLDELAEQAYEARIKDLQYIKNNKRYGFTNRDNAYAYSDSSNDINKITDNWLETYTGQKPKKINADTPIDEITPEQYESFFNLKKPESFKEHGLYPRENIGLKFGRYHDFNKTIAHELGHISQANRKLPIEDRLRHAAQPYGLYPGRVPSSDTPRLTFSNNDIKNHYDYFKKHHPLSKRKSDEPYAFAHETKQLLLDHGIIKDWFDPITEKTIKKARKYFDKKPFGVYNLSNSEFKTGTRMLDFTHPSRYKMLAKELNKIAPATIIGTGAAAGLMNNKKTGGEEKELTKYQTKGEVKHRWDNPVLQRALSDSAKVANSLYLQKILKQKQEWEAANAPVVEEETSPTPEFKMMPDNFELKSGDAGKYNNPDLYAQPEAPTSELDQAITNRDFQSYSDILNPFKNPYMKKMLPDEEYYAPEKRTPVDPPQTVEEPQDTLDGGFDSFEFVKPPLPPKDESNINLNFEEDEFTFMPFSLPNYNFPDNIYNNQAQRYYDQNEKADAKMQDLYYTITNPSVSQEEKDSAQKQFDELESLIDANIGEINRIKKIQAGPLDVFIQEETPSWLSKGLQKVGFSDDYSLEAPAGEKLYEDYQTKANKDYEKELVTKSYESLNTPGESGQWYRWKYRVNASNEDPITVKLYGNRGERDKKDPNIKGLGAMMHFLDQSPLTGASHPSMKNFYKRLGEDQYIGYLENVEGDTYKLMYKKAGELSKDELNPKNTFYLRTEDFDNINFDGKRVVDNNFAGHTYWTRKDNGKAAIPISIGHNDNDYNYSSGNAVVFIFDHNDQRRYIQFAGSPNAIRKEGERIKKDYKLNPNNLTIGIADAGSYASAVKADKQGKINNQLLNSKDYGYWNLNNYTGAGMVLQDDFKSGGEYMEAELTPEEINWYLSQGYQVDELE